MARLQMLFTDETERSIREEAAKLDMSAREYFKWLHTNHKLRNLGPRPSDPPSPQQP